MNRYDQLDFFLMIFRIVFDHRCVNKILLVSLTRGCCYYTAEALRLLY